MLGDQGGISIVRCDGCGLVHATAGYGPRFLDGFYTERAERAPTSLDPRAPRPASERKRQALALYDRLMGGRLRPAPSGALALDVGCGIGLLLDLLRAAGYDTVGIERSGAAAQAIAAGHRVLAIDVEVGDELPERFALITLTHVLEHLRRPEAALRWIGAHLGEGGVAIVEVPNWDDVARPLWGRRYRPLELGDHLSFFQRHTLTALAARAGLRVDAMWSGAQARTLLLPSLLTGLDLSLATARRLRHRQAGAAPTGVGVASARAVVGKDHWRHSAVTAALARLDHLDPWLESVSGSGWAHGPNLVAVLRPAERG